MKEFFEEHDLGISKKDLQKINTRNILSDRTSGPNKTKRSGNTLSVAESVPNTKPEGNVASNPVSGNKNGRKKSKSKSVARAAGSKLDKALSIKEDVLIEDFDVQMVPKSKSGKQPKKDKDRPKTQIR